MNIKTALIVSVIVASLMVVITVFMSTQNSIVVDSVGISTENPHVGIGTENPCTGENFHYRKIIMNLNETRVVIKGKGIVENASSLIWDRENNSIEVD